MIFADSIGSSNTGLALANPGDDPVTLDLILNDAAGVERARRQDVLAPRGHLARFIDELFPSVNGIDEFEGSVVIRSVGVGVAGGETPSGSTPPPDFAGMTLRVTGDLLTSLPMVAPARPQDQFTRLAFTQVADGAGAGLVIDSSFILFNNTDSPVTGDLELFKSDPSPLMVSLDGTLASSFPFSLQPGQIWRRTTGATGDIQVGWGRVTMDQPIAGSGLFTTRDASGEIVSEVGVSSAKLGEETHLVVDTQGRFNTGMAIAFPISPEISSRDVARRIRVSFELIDSQGVQRARAPTRRFERLEHQSFFVTELFPNFTEFSDFEGWLKITARDQGGNREPAPIAVLALRSAIEKLTSTPSLIPQYGFAPFSELLPDQNLAGTSPPVRFRLVQNAGDMQLSSLTLSAPSLGLNSDAVQPGDFFGFVTLGYNAVGRLLATGDESIEFEVLGSESGGFPAVTTYTNVASGRLIGSPDGNLVVELSVESAPNKFQTRDAVWEFFVDPGIIQVPETPGPVEVATEYVSVSRSSKRDEGRVRFQVSQTLDFDASSGNQANLFSAEPRFPLPNQPVTLTGSNFGSSPQVQLSVAGGDVRTIPVVEAGDTGIVFAPPADLVEGTIAVDNGNGPGNDLNTRVLFAPRIELVNLEDDGGTPEDESGFGFQLTPTADEFGISSFTVRLQDVSMDFSALAPEQMVGSAMAFGSPLEVVVEQVDGDILSLDGRHTGGGASRFKLQVRQLEEDLLFSYTTVLFGNVEPDGVVPVLTSPSNTVPTQISLTGLELQGVSSGDFLLGVATLTSFPTDVGGVGTALDFSTLAVSEIP